MQPLLCRPDEPKSSNKTRTESSHTRTTTSAHAGNNGDAVLVLFTMLHWE
jgi:hypothetical protein